MYARSTTIDGKPSSVDDGIAFIRDEVMPMVMTMDGCIGMSLVVDRETGRCIATTSWRDEEAMTASRDKLAPYRARGAEVMGGSPAVEEWEVAVMHRDHTSREGSCCRITWGRPTDMDALAEYFRSTVMPKIESMDGFCSVSLFLDRANGVSCGTATFDSRAALEASREPAAALRQAVTDAGMVEFFDVGEFDLEMAHLRLPELV